MEFYTELIALGACNMFVSWFTGTVAAGSFSRSAVAENVGSQTPLYSLFTGIVIAISILCLLPFFVFLPKCCLSCIVVVAVMNLFDFKEMIRLWNIKKKDFFVMLCTLCFTLILDIEMGIALGVIVSILMFVQSAANPSYAVLGRILESNTFINVKTDNENQAQRLDECLIFRWDESLWFGNMEMFKTKIDKEIESFLDSHHTNGNRWCLVLCFAGINDIDVSAADFLHSFLKELVKKYRDEIHIVLTDVKDQPKDVLTRCCIIENHDKSIGSRGIIIARSQIFVNISQAVDAWIATNGQTSACDL